MTKSRKILALMMVLAIMLSVLAIPAAATAIDAEVEPRGAVVFCPQCLSATDGCWTSTTTKTVSVGKNECSYRATEHTHSITYYYENIDCPNCGTYKIQTAYAVYCRYANVN